ncbi:MAG TPA: META domain-containing protein [Flavobacteriaceae bacterium]|nr:META domain-containing protein [Flavobacteriaceae bacterium]
MKIKFLIVFAFCFSLLACDDSEKAPENLTQTYYGMLPCADCPGIYYELKFNPNFTYSEKRFYLESNVDTITEKGTFEIENDSVIILKAASEEKGLSRLKMSDGELKFLNGDGKQINSPLKDFFVLKTTKPTGPPQMENSVLKQKFNATGNEPFWGLEINPKKNTISFKEPEGTSITVSIPEPELLNGKLIYKTDADPGKLEVTILEETCQDGMSGEMFTHKVSVTFKTAEMEKAKTFQGCGEYAIVRKEAKALAGNWILKKINGNGMTDNAALKVPRMQIDLMENRVAGNAGCNQFSGNIELLEANQIAFFQIISTKMACKNMELETKFLQMLSQNRLTYSVKEDKLILSNSENELVFKKKG